MTLTVLSQSTAIGVSQQGKAGAPGPPGAPGKDAATLDALATARPGDQPLFFTTTTDLYSPQSSYPPLLAAGLTVGAQGSIYRMSGEAICATRMMFFVEPGRTYQARLGFTRTQNAADPAGDTVRLGLLAYDANLGLIQAVPLRDTNNAAVASGHQNVAVTVARQPYGPGNLPPNTCYARLYVQTYGGQQATDVEVIRWSDVSDCTLFSPDVATLANAIAAETTRAEAAEAAINPFGAKVIDDIDYAAVAADLGIVVRTLTAPRTITLPALNSVQRFRPFPIADESGLCAPTRPITVKPTGSDLINGSSAPVTIDTAFELIAPRAGLTTWTL